MSGVYKAINAVQAALAKQGIGKGQRNAQQGYSFRGIDDFYNALAPLLAENHLCIIPRVLSRECVERTSTQGKVLFYVTVQTAFDLVCSEDGTTHTAVTYGEAMDSADKATNKAMSAAYKYMATQAFCAPTQGDNDADATTHEVAPTVKAQGANAAAMGGDPLGEGEETEAKLIASTMLALHKKHIAGVQSPDPEWQVWELYEPIRDRQELALRVWNLLGRENSKVRTWVKKVKDYYTSPVSKAEADARAVTAPAQAAP